MNNDIEAVKTAYIAYLRTKKQLGIWNVEFVISNEESEETKQ